MARWIVFVSAFVVATATAARADDAPPQPTPFDRGKLGFGFGGGTQTNFGAQYILIGASAGYFVLDGVELGLSGLHEFGGGPSISALSPSLRYVAKPLVGRWPVVPYVGATYAHWFIGGANPDVDTLGGRAGLMFVSRADPGWFLFGLGVAYDHVMNAGCSVNCDSVYPDVTLGFAF